MASLWKSKTGSTITADKYYGITLNGQNADITIEDSKVDAWGCLTFFNSASGNKVDIAGSSQLVAKNPHGAGENNYAAIVFRGTGNSVTLNENSSIACTGGNTSSNQMYVASFYSTEENTLTLNGSVSVSGNLNGQ